MKITRQEWDAIGIYNHAAKWLRPFCEYRLVKEENHYRREQLIGIVPYILMCIPVHILQALVCMWDGGLKEFYWQDRYLGYDDILKWQENYETADKIYNKK